VLHYGIARQTDNICALLFGPGRFIAQRTLGRSRETASKKVGQKQKIKMTMRELLASTPHKHINGNAPEETSLTRKLIYDRSIVSQLPLTRE
jgi:hypothetical protein